MGKYKKLIVSLFLGIVLIFAVKIIYACTYVGDILVTYPWDKFSISEKFASYITGVGKSETAQELYDKGIISNTEGPFQKFNKKHYK